METTGIIGVIQGLYRDYIGDMFSLVVLGLMGSLLRSLGFRV